MKILKDILQKTAVFFKEKGIENPSREADVVIADALEMKRLDLYTQFDRPLNDGEVDRCLKSVQRRAKREPSQYIRGRVDFFGCEINVSPEVLIPRQETEILVSNIAAKLSQIDSTEKVLWDLCCGSGCIGIALKKKLPGLKVVLSDVSTAALEVARRNAVANDVDVDFLEGDLLEPFETLKADFVVCNPPYVSLEEYETLPEEVREYEPKIALVALSEGVEFYQRLAKDLPGHLNPDAMVWLEIGSKQAKSIKTLFSWADVKVEQDWAGHDRFVILSK